MDLPETTDQLRERANIQYGLRGLNLLGLVAAALAMLAIGAIGLSGGRAWGWLLASFSAGALFALTFLRPILPRRGVSRSPWVMRGLILMGCALVVLDTHSA